MRCEQAKMGEYGMRAEYLQIMEYKLKREL